VNPYAANSSRLTFKKQHVHCWFKHQSVIIRLQQTGDSHLSLPNAIDLGWYRYWDTRTRELIASVQAVLLFSYFEPEENRATGIDGPHTLQLECSIRPDGLRTPFNAGANNSYTMPLLLEGWKWIVLYRCADYWKGQIVQRVLLTLQQTLLNGQFTASMQQAASKFCSNSQICNLACW
jgi:hypothetical protein